MDQVHTATRVLLERRWRQPSPRRELGVSAWCPRLWRYQGPQGPVNSFCVPLKMLSVQCLHCPCATPCAPAQLSAEKMCRGEEELKAHRTLLLPSFPEQPSACWHLSRRSWSLQKLLSPSGENARCLLQMPSAIALQWLQHACAHFLPPPGSQEATAGPAFCWLFLRFVVT